MLNEMAEWIHLPVHTPADAPFSKTIS